MIMVNSAFLFPSFSFASDATIVQTKLVPITWPATSAKLVKLGIPVNKGDAEIKRSQCIAKELILGVPATKVLYPTIGQSITQGERRQVIEATKLIVPAKAVEGINVSLRCQEAYFVHNGIIARVFPVSTGKPGFATETGTYRVSWQVDDWYRSLAYPDSMLYRPKFFHGGEALHGLAWDSAVSPFPASHGCIRAKRADMDWIWKVWDGKTDRVRVY